MPVFAYSATNAESGVLRGTIAADSPALARQRLRDQGLAVQRLTPCEAPARRFLAASRSARKRTDCTTELWRHLAVLLRAGVPLADALQVCAREQRGAVRSVIEQLLDRLRAGGALSDALRDQPRWFEPLAVGVVAVGERSGALADVLAELAAFQQRRRALGRRLATALSYPLLLCCVGAVVVGFLVGHVIPQLLDVLAASSQALPAPTRVLMTLGGLATSGGPWLAAGLAAALAGSTYALRFERCAHALERTVLRVPLVGGLLRKLWIARLSLMLSLLLRSGVGFVDALRLVRRGLPSRVFGRELEHLSHAVESGRGLAQALRGNWVMPAMVVHLLAVGQETGELPAMLAELRSAYEQEVDAALTRLTALLEPLLIVLLALIVAFVVFATLLPILEITRGMQA